jgi:hypothetical protein
MLVDAVAGLQVGVMEPATDYLRFVEKHRGRPAALQARKRIAQLRREESWQDCKHWPAWGYQTKPPAPPPSAKAKRKR